MSHESCAVGSCECWRTAYGLSTRFYEGHLSTVVKLHVKAAEEVCVDQKGEPLPVWTPPTPPQQDEYRVDPWAAAYEQQPLNMPMKRFKVFAKCFSVFHQVLGGNHCSQRSRYTTVLLRATSQEKSDFGRKSVFCETKWCEPDQPVYQSTLAYRWGAHATLGNGGAQS